MENHGCQNWLEMPRNAESAQTLHLQAGSIWPQAFFSFLAPHSHLATRPSSFPQSHTVPRVTISRNKRTSSRYCSYHGCWKAWGFLRWAAPLSGGDVVDPAHQPLGKIGAAQRLMMLAASAADLYLLTQTEGRC